MTPNSELDRLFDQVFPTIPKPDPLEYPQPMWRVSSNGLGLSIERIEPRDIYIDHVDADEAVNGVCVQGDDACAT